MLKSPARDDLALLLADGFDSELIGDPDEMRERFRFHLVHHMSPMRFYGPLRSSQLEADLLVKKSGSDEREHFAFTRGETLIFPL